MATEELQGPRLVHCCKPAALLSEANSRFKPTIGPWHVSNRVLPEMHDEQEESIASNECCLSSPVPCACLSLQDRLALSAETRQRLTHTTRSSKQV